MKGDRPPRRAIPVRVRLTIIAEQNICPCGCGLELTVGLPTHWDHEPALRLRDVNADHTDYTPPQHDPLYIVGRCVPSHKAKTHGTGATTAGTDIGKIAKQRKRERPPKVKRKWATRPFGKSRGFEPRGSRPMRKRT